MSDHHHHHRHHHWPFHLHKPHPGLSRRLHLPHGVQPVFETYTFALHGRDYHCSFHPCYSDNARGVRYCGRLLPEMLGAHHVDVEVFGQDMQGALAREAGLSFARRVLRRCGGGGAPQVKGRIEVVDSALTAVDEVDYKFCVCSRKVRKEDAVLVLDVPHAKNEVVRTYLAPEPGCACADRHSTSGNDKNSNDNNNHIQDRNGRDHHHYVKQQQQQHQDHHHRNGNRDGHYRKDHNDNEKDDSDSDNDPNSESLPPVVAEFLWKASKLEPSTEMTRFTAVVIDDVYYLTSAELCKSNGDVSGDGRLTPSAPFAEAEFLDLCDYCLQDQAFAGIQEAFRSELLPTDFCPRYEDVMILNESRVQYGGCQSRCSAFPDCFTDVMNGNNYVMASGDLVTSRDSATIGVCDPPPSYSETDPFPWDSYFFFKSTDSRHCSR